MEPLTTGLLIALMVASFYFLIIRPNRKRQAAQTKLMDSMAPGARVMLNSGIYATVVEVGEKQVIVELAPGVEVKALKQAVLQVITPDSQFAEETDTPEIPDTPESIAGDVDNPLEDQPPVDEWPRRDDRPAGDKSDPRGDDEGQKG